MSRITKASLVKQIATNAVLPQRTVELVLEQLAREVFVFLAPDTDFPLPHLGKLKVVKTAARKGRNPATGDEIDIPENVKIKFVPAAELRRDIAAASKRNSD